MRSPISFDEVEVGTELPARTFVLTRASLVRYAGASGDFNPIHWSERYARDFDLPDVIAHGMFTMSEAARVVTDWARDPGSVLEYKTRFTKPVVVPDEGDTSIEVTGRVGAKLDGERVRVDLTVTCAGAKVLTEARAVVQLSP